MTDFTERASAGHELARGSPASRMGALAHDHAARGQFFSSVANGSCAPQKIPSSSDETVFVMQTAENGLGLRRIGLSPTVS